MPLLLQLLVTMHIRLPIYAIRRNVGSPTSTRCCGSLPCHSYNYVTNTVTVVCLLINPAPSPYISYLHSHVASSTLCSTLLLRHFIVQRYSLISSYAHCDVCGSVCTVFLTCLLTFSSWLINLPILSFGARLSVRKNAYDVCINSCMYIRTYTFSVRQYKMFVCLYLSLLDIYMHIICARNWLFACGVHLCVYSLLHVRTWEYLC
jgi:hypothetical protein